MIVNIEPSKMNTLITFKAKDLTCFNDIFSIASAMANSYCFEARVLLSPEFESFIETLKPRITYGIRVGYDMEGEPYVEWGKVKRRKN